ncbi:MAG TPA: hypothetical protein VK541_02290 [Pedobacter sp.]|uniref:hypothetical protein n=1 Tax=Pedobacter sp. TaxID=1411316 RepID=UPI002CA08E19|nr:hypothetical protein [Pedobacter sp.]HMI01280.1 hypothetical protein [Pedobacter sp.]
MGSSKIKAYIIVGLMIFAGMGNSYGQTFAEFFKQKKTQKKYLLEQIAALEMYASYLKKGYEIVNGGLQTIKDLSNGEFSLHNAFISGLKKVSPVIKNNIKVAEIIEMQIRIGKAFNRIKSNANLSLSNQLYIQEVRESLWEETLKDLEELLLVITSGKVEMSDDQRIERLDKLYRSMQDKAAFAQSFTTEISQFIRQKEMEKKSIEQLRNRYEIQE